MDFRVRDSGSRRLKVAIIGAGISGLSATWLISKSHDVTVFEASDRLGGHSNTRTFRTDVGEVAVDTGFIVYNEVTYPFVRRQTGHASAAPTSRHQYPCTPNQETLNATCKKREASGMPPVRRPSCRGQNTT